MSQTNLTLIGNRSGNTECLQALTDSCCSICRSLAALLDRDSRAYGVCPLCILKTDGLNALDHLINIKACILGDLFRLFDGSNSIAVQCCINLFDTSLIGFK